LALPLRCPAILFALGNVLNREALPMPPPVLLVPVIGVVSAAFILGEPMGLHEVAAMVLTLGGVTLALQKTSRAFVGHSSNPLQSLVIRALLGITSGACLPAGLAIAGNKR
jgi:drug/metabolite transporter (DMT)-like permease